MKGRRRFGLHRMEVAGLLKLAVPLAVLGLISTMLASLFLAFVIASKAGGITTGVICLVLAGVLLFFAFFRNEDSKLKGILIFVAVFDLIGGLTSCLLPTNFHDDSSHVNRASIYFIILTALICSLAYFWQFVTGFVSSGYYEAAGIEKGQEVMLYVFWGLIVSFIESFIIPLKDTYDRSALVKGAIVYSIGLWFLGGILAGGLGVVVLFKSQAGPPPTTTEALSTASPISEYDKIG